jgi:hypothetical protein
MEHSDFPKILQTFLPIVIFVLWAMFSSAGKKRKIRNYPPQQTRKPVPQSDHEPELEKQTYHYTPDKELESKAKQNPVISSTQKAAVPAQLPQHQPAIKISMPSDLQVHISSAHGSSGPAPINDYGRYSPEELQKLVVWSEVLGRPVAMREPD